MATKASQLRTPRVFGTGLVALDVVVNEKSSDPVQYYTGGTCGNVLLALRYLGWSSTPIARLGTDPASSSIAKDLDRWKVNRDYIQRDEGEGTPIIIHKITRNKSGQPVHSFSWRCQVCGNRFPPFKPLLVTTAESIAHSVKKAEVFFFDRVSRGILTLAKAFAQEGAVLVFEPISVGNPKMFREACQIAHIIKYSHERMADAPIEVEESDAVRLHIETLGEDGLRYRMRRKGRHFNAWNTSDAISVEDIKDSAGAGDWCTAGILSEVAAKGLASLDSCSAADIKRGIRYGQALAAWTCMFDGARGGMYAVSKAVFKSQVKKIIEGEEQASRDILPIQKKLENAIAAICNCCKPSKSKQSKIKRRSG